MTNQPQPNDPPRRPLRVRVSGHYQAADGTTLGYDGWRIVEPGDADYDQEYIIAAGTHRLYGMPMPYADDVPSHLPEGE